MVIVTYYREAFFNNHPPQIAVGVSTAFPMVGVPDPIFSSPSIKEKIAVWLRNTRVAMEWRVYA